MANLRGSSLAKQLDSALVCALQLFSLEGSGSTNQRHAIGVKSFARTLRALRILLAVLSLLYLVYGVGVYVALRGGALAALTRDLDDLKIEAKGGYSFWPGRFVLEGPRFRFKDHNIEVELLAHQLRLRVSLIPFFFDKTIQVDEFLVQDARFKMLHRVHDGAKNRERLAAFPDIGFDRPKVYDEPSPPYRVPPYRIRVHRIRGNALEAWILEYRAVGEFEAEGGFELHEMVKVFPSRVTFDNAQIFSGKKEVLRQVRCDLGAEVGPFPGKEGLEKVLGTVNGTIRCDAKVSDLSALHLYFPDSELVARGSGEAKTDLRLTLGQLRSSTLDVNLKLERFGLPRSFLSGEAQLTTRVDATGLAEVGVRYQGDEARDSSLELETADVNLKVRQPKLWQPALERAELDLKGLSIKDPEFARQAIGNESVPIMKIERTGLNFSMVVPEQERKGSLELHSAGAVAVFPKKGSEITCLYRASVRCELHPGDAECGGSEFECSPLTIVEGPESSGSVSGSFRADSLAIEPEAMRSAWRVSLTNPKPILRGVLAENVWTDLGLSLMPLGALEATARINRKGPTFAGTVDSFQAGLVSGKGGFLIQEGVVSRWLINTPVVRFGVEQSVSGTQVHPFVSNDWSVRALEGEE